MLSQLSPGFDRFPRRVERVVEVLTAGGGWQLTLTDDAREALPFLRRMLDETDARAGFRRSVTEERSDSAIK